MDQQAPRPAWLNDPKGTGIMYDGTGIVWRGVYLPDEIYLLLLDAFRDAVVAERERCCRIVYGQCSSDNTAERTVRDNRTET